MCCPYFFEFCLKKEGKKYIYNLSLRATSPYSEDPSSSLAFSSGEKISSSPSHKSGEKICPSPTPRKESQEMIRARSIRGPTALQYTHRPCPFTLLHELLQRTHPSKGAGRGGGPGEWLAYPPTLACLRVGRVAARGQARQWPFAFGPKARFFPPLFLSLLLLFLYCSPSPPAFFLSGAIHIAMLQHVMVYALPRALA